MVNFYLWKKFTAVAIVVLLIPTHLLAASEDGLNGIWRGAILGKAGTKNHNLIVSFSGSARNPTVETQYLDFGCKGELKFQSKKRDVYTFTETIKHGTDKCVNGSTIQIDNSKNDTPTFKWLYPNGKLGLVADLVQDDGSEITAKEIVAELPDVKAVLETEEETTDEENKSLALRYLEDIAAHPEDPDNPAGVIGSSDEALANMAFEEIEELFEQTLEYAEAEVEQPRYLFALGRAAYLHGDEEFAKELLEKAEARGSAAASAYLAKTMDDSNLSGMQSQLRKAVNGGFKPAKAWLSEIETFIAEQEEAIRREEEKKRLAEFDFNRFNRPDLIKAFYNNDLSSIKDTELLTLSYISGIQEFLMDQSSVLFLVDDRRIVAEPDPNLSLRLQHKFINSGKAMDEAIDGGLNMMWGMLKAAAETRQRGGTVREEVQNVMNAGMNSPKIALEWTKNQAMQDAKILVSYYDTNPEDFRKVYSGIKSYVYGR